MSSQHAYSDVESFGPSFNCSKATTKLEKAICSDKLTSDYDSIINYLYQAILRKLPPEEAISFKQEQKHWLSKEKEEAFKEDKQLIESNYFEGQAWVSRLQIAYGDRIKHLLASYKNLLAEFLFDEFEKQTAENSIPKPLKYAFFYYIFTNTPESIEDEKGERRYNSALILDNEFRLTKLKEDSWLVAYRPSHYQLAITNGDGGIYRFYLLNLKQKILKPLKIESYYNIGSKPKFDTDLQGFLMDINRDHIVIGSGATKKKSPLGIDSCPKEKMLYKYDEYKNSLIILKKWENTCTSSEQITYEQSFQ